MSYKQILTINDIGKNAGQVASGNHEHIYLTTKDNRSDATIPSEYSGKFKFSGLKNNDIINSPSSDTYSYLVGLRGWHDDSGGFAHELAFNNTGLFYRRGNTNDTWLSWDKLLTKSNGDTNYVKKTGDTMTGELINSSNNSGAFTVATNANKYISLCRDSSDFQLYGLWDYIKNIWLVQSDGTNVYFHGNADSASKALGDVNGLQIDTNYLKLSGGTMSGNITFAQIATWPTPSGETYPIQSNKLKWSGSSDNAEIFYEVAGSDKGVLVLNVGDDADAIISFRSCGVEKGKVTTQGIWGAVWNDYAEFREGDTIESGKCVIEAGNDTLITSTERMMPGANITSDTFGFAIGETEQAKTPIAVSGRVLAYPYESREEFKKNIGRPVCSGPNGTVSIMTDEEYRDKGYCAIGTISAVPDYEEWGTGKVKVNGRVWIKVF